VRGSLSLLGPSETLRTPSKFQDFINFRRIKNIMSDNEARQKAKGEEGQSYGACLSGRDQGVTNRVSR